MTSGGDGPPDKDSVDGLVDEIVSRLGFHTFAETEATRDNHAAEVAAFIADAVADKARFDDTRDAS